MLRVRPDRLVVPALVLLSCAEPTAPDRDDTGGGGGPPLVAVASVVVTPASDTIGIGQSRTLSATPRDANGATVSGVSITWSTSDTAVATLTGSTLVGKREGTTTVRATANGVTGSASVTVRIPAARVSVDSFATKMLAGTQQTLSAAVLDSADAPLPLRPVRWRSSDTTIARVDSASGVVVAKVAGSVAIIASHAALADTAALTVDPAIALVVVTPGSVGLAVGDARQLSAVALSAAGDTVTGYPIVWSSAWNHVAEIDRSSGLLQGQNVGNTTVHASVGGRGGIASVSVGGSVDSVEVSPTSIEVGEGVSRSLTATPRDAAGAALTGRALTWTSLQPAIATVSASGVVTGVAAGQTSVMVSAEGQSSTVAVRVRPSVNRVRITPDTIYTARWSQRRVTVTALSAAGDTVHGRVATWTAYPTPTGISFAPNDSIYTSRLGTFNIVATVDGVSDTSVVVVGQPAASISMPLSQRTYEGSTTRIPVTLLDSSGVEITGRPITWESTAPHIATVDSTGLITTYAVGSAYIVARSEGLAASTGLDVRRWPVKYVSATPDPVVLRRWERLQLAAETRDSLGRVLSGRLVQYQSLRPTVFTVSDSGVIHGLLADTGSVIVFSELGRDTVPVTVEPATPVASVTLAPASGSVVQYTYLPLVATLRDAAGNVLPPRPLTWTSTNNNIAYGPGGNAGAIDGYAYGVAPGTATIRAGGVNADGKLGSASITVIAPPPVASIAITPSPGPLRLDRFVEMFLEVTLWDASGNELTDRPVTWTSTDSNVVSVIGGSSGASITTRALGQATIRAASGGRTASLVINVTPPPSVATVTVTPDAGSYEAGTTAQLTAVVRDSAGNVLTDRLVSWASLNSTVAGVSGSGLVSFRAAGSTQVVVASGGKADTATFTVTPEQVAALSVSPNPVQVAHGGTIALTATVRDARGVVLQGRLVNWTSDDPALATFDSAGVLRGLAQGTGSITVTSEGTSVSVPFTVGPPAVAAVTIDPSLIVTFVGESAVPETRVFGTTGTALTDRAISYTVGDPTVATVSPSGVVYGVKAGSTYLRATVEGVSAVAEILVESAEVDTIVVRPVNPSVMVGQYVQFHADFYNATGSLLPTRPVTWRTSDYLVGYGMNNEGLFYGREGGSSLISATYVTPSGDSIRGSSLMRVTAQPPSIAELLVSPNPLNLNVGQGSGLTVTPLDANRQVIWGTPAPTFRSDNTSVATVSSSGYVTARGGGTTRIYATVNGFEGFTTVNVSGSGSGGGGDTGGGTGGGDTGGGSGGVCNSTTSITAPGPGQTTAWYRLAYPKNLEVQVRAGTFNHGTAAAPEYNYFFNYRNGYGERLFFNIGWQMNATATSTAIAEEVAAGSTRSRDAFIDGAGTISLYVAGARLGSFTAPVFCE